MFLPPECLRMHRVILSTAVLLVKTPQFSINSYPLLLRLCQILNSGVTQALDENFVEIYILSSVNLFDTSLSKSKSIDPEIRKLLFIPLRNHNNKKVRHFAILIVCVRF